MATADRTRCDLGHQPLLTGCDAATFRPMRPDDANGRLTPRLRLAAVGCGRVFERFYLPAIRRSSEWELVAAVDQRPERLRWISELYPGLAVAPVLNELVKSDAVLISSPPDSHAALATAALHGGAHALIEKPMTISPSDAASLLGHARAAGRRVLVGFNRRFRPSYARLRERLRDRPGSSIRLVSCELRTDPSAWGAVAPGGDVLDDLASHQLDLVPWILGRAVEEVRAVVERARPAGETAEIELRLTGGIVARCRAVHGSDSAEWLHLHLEDRLIIANIGGIITAPRAISDLARRYLGARTTLSSAVRRLTGAPAFTAETFERQLAAWAGAIGGGPDGDWADGADGSRCVALIAACRRSSAAGGAWVAPEAG